MPANIIKPAFVLFFVCLIVSACLAVTNAVTEGKIEERIRLETENARKEVLSNADTFEALDGINDIIANKPGLKPVKEVYKGLANGTSAGYVFTVVTKGYGGDIKIIVGIDNKGEVTGVKVSKSEETPGLGAKASDEPFISQFYGVNPQEPLKVVKMNKSKPEEVQAISGATITSRAVVKAVQAAVDMSHEIIGKEGDIE